MVGRKMTRHSARGKRDLGLEDQRIGGKKGKIEGEG